LLCFFGLFRYKPYRIINYCSNKAIQRLWTAWILHIASELSDIFLLLLAVVW
jgi:hypothetical protein